MSGSSGKRRYRKQVAHGKHRKRRPGVHKNAASPETKRWNTEELIPKRPPWMPADVYVKLADIRRSL